MPAPTPLNMPRRLTTPADIQRRLTAEHRAQRALSPLSIGARVENLDRIRAVAASLRASVPAPRDGAA